MREGEDQEGGRQEAEVRHGARVGCQAAGTLAISWDVLMGYGRPWSALFPYR